MKVTKQTSSDKVPFDLRTGEGRGREIPRRPPQAAFRRPDPMALQRPPQGFRAAAAGRRRPPARLPLAAPDRLRVFPIAPPSVPTAWKPMRMTTASSACRHQRGAARRRPPARPARRGLRRRLEPRHASGTCWPPAAPSRPLEDWLRDNFFEQHCKLFQQPPLHLAHLGRPARTASHALVNYHKLDHANAGER